MSCVVTNKFSDWSKLPWVDNRIALRVHKMHDDYVVGTLLLEIQMQFNPRMAKKFLLSNPSRRVEGVNFHDFQYGCTINNRALSY